MRLMKSHNDENDMMKSHYDDGDDNDEIALMKMM